MEMTNMDKDKQSADRHSDEIDQIITKIPAWIVRWGIGIFGLILIMALSISAVIRYPDTIKLPVKIQTGNSPAGIFASTEISQDNFTKVKAGQQALIRLRVFANADAPIKGVIGYVAAEPNERGLFSVKIILDPGTQSALKLKNWMTGSVEIITQDVTVLQRLTKQLIKS